MTRQPLSCLTQLLTGRHCCLVSASSMQTSVSTFCLSSGHRKSMEDVYRKADRTSFVLYCLWIYILPLLYFLQYYCLPGLFVCLYPGYIDPLLPLQRLGSTRLYQIRPVFPERQSTFCSTLCALSTLYNLHWWKNVSHNSKIAGSTGSALLKTVVEQIGFQ